MAGRMIHAELQDLTDLHCRGLNGGVARRDAGSLVALFSEREGHRRRIRVNRKAESVPPSRAIAGPTAPSDRLRALTRRSASKRQRGKTHGPQRDAGALPHGRNPCSLRAFSG